MSSPLCVAHTERGKVCEEHKQSKKGICPFCECCKRCPAPIDCSNSAEGHITSNRKRGMCTELYLNSILSKLILNIEIRSIDFN